ncbi:MAG: Hsp20/alpha crystallin family protein [Kiritimatiellia bacterium]
MKYYSTVDKDALDLMDSLFNNWGHPGGGDYTDFGAFPRYKARRTDEGLEAAFELPGVEPDKANISVESDLLKVSGERHEFGKEDAVKFERTLRVPDDLDVAGIKANLKNGLLSVKIPKVKKEEPKQIAIKVE